MKYLRIGSLPMMCRQQTQHVNWGNIEAYMAKTLVAAQKIMLGKLFLQVRDV
jgi:hypothetical protein